MNAEKKKTLLGSLYLTLCRFYRDNLNLKNIKDTTEIKYFCINYVMRAFTKISEQVQPCESDSDTVLLLF